MFPCRKGRLSNAKCLPQSQTSCVSSPAQSSTQDNQSRQPNRIKFPWISLGEAIQSLLSIPKSLIYIKWEASSLTIKVVVTFGAKAPTTWIRTQTPESSTLVRQILILIFGWHYSEQAAHKIVLKPSNVYEDRIHILQWTHDTCLLRPGLPH